MASQLSNLNPSYHEQKSSFTPSVNSTAPSHQPPAYAFAAEDDTPSNHTISRTIFKILKLLLIFVTALVLILSAVVVGTTGASLHQYNATSITGTWLLPLWPDTIDLKSTKAVLGCMSTVLVIIFATLAVLVVPVLSHLSPIVTLVTSFITVVLTLTSLILSAKANASNPPINTIANWSCQWADSFQKIPEMDYSKLCSETTWAHWGMVVVLIFEIGTIAVAATAWFFARRLRGIPKVGA